jgi:hypothetical protein
MGGRSLFKLFVYACEHVSTPELVRFLAVGFVLGGVAAGTSLRKRPVILPAPPLIGVAAVSTFPFLLIGDIVTFASGQAHQVALSEVILYGCYAVLVAIAAAVPHVLVQIMRRSRGVH